MSSQKDPFIRIFPLEQFRWTEVPKHYDVVLGVKRVVKAHSSTRAVRGIVRGRANPEPQDDYGCENREAGENEQSQAAIELGIFVVHKLNDSYHLITFGFSNTFERLTSPRRGCKESRTRLRRNHVFFFPSLKTLGRFLLQLRMTVRKSVSLDPLAIHQRSLLLPNGDGRRRIGDVL